jgi:hypothetical protein
MIAKCANPACPARFHHGQGGKFFGFHHESATNPASPIGVMAYDNTHHAEHYWLCARCCQVLTLVHVEGRGVVLKALWEELPVTEAPKQLVEA